MAQTSHLVARVCTELCADLSPRRQVFDAQLGLGGYAFFASQFLCSALALAAFISYISGHLDRLSPSQTNIAYAAASCVVAALLISGYAHVSLAYAPIST